MAKENKSGGKVPNLRFPGFEGEWEVKSLGDIGEVKMCKRIFNEQTRSTGDVPFFKISSFGKEADAFISKELYFDYKKRFSFPKKGDVLISAAGTIGRTVVYNGADAYFQDSNIVWIDNDKNIISNEFLYYILQIVKYNTEGGTIQRLYNNILKSTKFSNPTTSEQNKIASFISLIDERIHTQNKIIRELEASIRDFRTQIFNQKLRFKSLKFGWKEKKLAEIAKFYSGGTPLTSKREFFGGDIPFIRSGEINSENTEQFITELGLNNSSAKMVEVGDILYALYGATSGEVGISKIKGAINQAILCIKSNQNHYFIYSYLLYKKESIIRTYIQGGQGNLSAEIVKQLSIPLPPIEEQNRIASFLSKVDQKIQNEKQILLRLKKQKKYLLRQMFI